MSTHQIIETYDRIEAGEPDISTERLLVMTAEQCRCDVSDVVEALIREQRAMENIK